MFFFSWERWSAMMNKYISSWPDPNICWIKIVYVLYRHYCHYYNRERRVPIPTRADDTPTQFTRQCGHFWNLNETERVLIQLYSFYRWDVFYCKVAEQFAMMLYLSYYVLLTIQTCKLLIQFVKPSSTLLEHILNIDKNVKYINRIQGCPSIGKERTISTTKSKLCHSSFSGP